jgi:hypothetical protein
MRNPPTNGEEVMRANAIIIEYADGPDHVIGPFQDEQAALEWIRTHSIILTVDEAKTKIVEMIKP